MEMLWPNPEPSAENMRLTWDEQLVPQRACLPSLRQTQAQDATERHIVCRVVRRLVRLGRSDRARRDIEKILGGNPKLKIRPQSATATDDVIRG